MNRLTFLALAALLLAPLAALHAAAPSISNTEPRRDTQGDILDAHYYVLFDTCCCFGPEGSGARVYTAERPLGPYTLRGNINRDAKGKPIIAAQQTYVAQLPTSRGTVYIWMGDRWGSRPDGIKGHDFQFWSSPLQFEEDGMIKSLTWDRDIGDENFVRRNSASPRIVIDKAMYGDLTGKDPGRILDLTDTMAKDFADSPLRWHSRPLWFWNGKLEVDKTKAMVDACKASGYYGMGILPCNGIGFDFMSPKFLKQYKAAVDEAAKQGMKMCLYDEYWFPSGSAGGLLAAKHPEALGKRLDMLATDVTGPKEFTRSLPPGTLMGIVAMEASTKKRLNITAEAKDATLRWNVPAGDWKIMIFTCVRDGGAGLVDYLEPQAVQAFISLTYQAYHDAMPEHFGTTIDGAFYDEPAMYHVQGGRAWTDRLNERFREIHPDIDPVVLYPSLWLDIGPDTASARNALFGMRAELFATGFVKTISDWCTAHHMSLTGHADQEEVANPVIGTVGDLIKAFKYQSMPGIDQVFAYGRASRAYKVVSSAACNYDRPQVMVECYGGMDLPLPNLYKEAMDQFAKGINTMVPHAVWYNPAAIIFKPNLSPGDPKYGPELPAYNQYIGRLQRLLQGGRHVADIGVLYPIATLQAGSWFGPGNPYEGCVEIPEADYMRVGELLALDVRRDFTFVHPEVLDEKCVVAGAELHLDNKVNAEQYKVFIIPGSRAIHWSSLKKIKEFYDNGGKVIATTRLPESSAEFGKDKDVKETVAAMFGAAGSKKVDFEVLDSGGRNLAHAGDSCTCNTNAKGGKAYFIRSPQAAALKAVLDDALKVYDVAFERDILVHNGNLSYIHKVVEGRDVYFVGNSSDDAVDTFIRLRGKQRLECWDPHTGRISACESEAIADSGCGVTRVRLQLAPMHSVFLVGPQASN